MAISGWKRTREAPVSPPGKPPAQTGTWLVVGVGRGRRVVLGEYRTRAAAAAEVVNLMRGGIEGYEAITVESKEDDVEEKRRALSLAEAEARTPPVSAVEALKGNLQIALFEGIGEADIAGMVAKLKEKALAGDLKAMKLLFDLVLSPAAGARPMRVLPSSNGNGKG